MMKQCELTVALMVKLASVVVHVEELLSSDGHEFDQKALEGLVIDAEVKEWLRSIPSVLLPVKRKAGA
jgi:hypothetical protein